MVYHLFEESGFLNDNLIEVICNRGNHKFVIYKSKNKKNDERFIYIDNLFSYVLFFRKLSINDIVIFHNFIFFYKFIIIFFIPLKNKIYWSFWGAELYVFKNFKKNILPKTYVLYGDYMPKIYYFRKRILLKIFRLLQWHIFVYLLKNKISKVLTNINEDFYNIKQYTNNKLNYGFFSYFILYESLLNLNKNNIINKVIVGHSSYQGCNHIETLDVLKLIECEITMPLSYGEEKYKEFLVKYIETYYNTLNIKIISDHMPYNDYINFLSSHSTFILNSNHQVGFNNVILCLSLGIKVYLRKENTIYLYLKRLGFIVFNIQDDKLDLSVLDDISKEKNLKLISIFFDKKNIIEEIMKNGF